ncbi:CocE/NonD family hydrolase [Amycolatopsis sacchari]|uniref:CocE/NonD family hydrolase n=1 Tax=Amycolatopsis dongchuanensis TaxID=1070866 RepID=A0ABP9QP54_9PSEU
MSVYEPLATSAPSVDDHGPHFAVEVVQDVRIPSGTPGTTLSADLFLPVAAGLVPALVTVLPYRKDATWGIRDFPTSRWYAERGYACVLVDFRGVGSSDGSQRPPFDPGEADDGVAAVEWAARQPWCNGNVGMWGHSYGAVLALRTASRGPGHLKAILPVMGMLDPERDFAHPGGTRGGLFPVARWGMQTFLNQLLPPLRQYGTAAEQKRWSDRLRNAEPWLLDLARRTPGDPAWRTRVVDARAITTPTYCIGGWQDIFCDGTIRAFEEIDAPKKLLVGPWTHTMPDMSQLAPVDFRALSLRWWEHWLRERDTGLFHEPPVTLYVQGAEPGWRGFDSWPPPGGQVRLATGADTVLRPRPVPEKGEVISVWSPDPTVGTVSSLWALPAEDSVLPLDQHEDDMRSLCCTSEPLERDVLIAGRARLSVGTLPGSPSRPMVARLSEVDADGRSRLITVGLAVATGPVTEVPFTPTCYRVRRGRRLRIALSNGDFPRLWPVSAVNGNTPMHLVKVALTLPAATLGSADVVPLPRPAPDAGPPSTPIHPSWTVSRDIVHSGVKVALGQELVARTPDGKHLLELRHDASASVKRAEPGAALTVASSYARAHLCSGEKILARGELRMTATTVTLSGEVAVDGATIFSRTWEVAVPDSAATQPTPRDGDRDASQ